MGVGYASLQHYLLEKQTGIPLFGGVGLNVPTKNGRLWFVDAENGSDRSGGGSPRRAVATIGEALDRCVSGAGDIVFVLPGTYEENVVVDKDYVSIVGGIQGYGRPDIGPATGMALHVNDAQGFVARGVRFFSQGALANLSATVGRLIRVEGNGFLFEDVVVDGEVGDHANSILLGLKGDADDDSYTASEGRIRDSYFRNAPGRGIAFETGEAPGNGVGSSDVVIERNRFFGNTGPDIVTRAAFAAGVSTVIRALIDRNWFVGPKNKATWIDLTTSIDGAASVQTGLIARNVFADDALDTTAVKMGSTGFAFVGNYDSVGVQDGSAFDD